MTAPTHLKGFQALEAVVRLGGVAPAAAFLGITPAAVGQRISGLEDALGMPLLIRGRSGMAVLPELGTALPELHRAFAALETAVGELEQQRGGEIHIAAASDFVDLWLMPRLASYRAANPAAQFCINGAGDVPMRLGRADCEIVFGPTRGGADRYADVLFHDFVLPVGSPLNVKRVAGLPEGARLEGFPLLHLDFYKDDPTGLSWPEWFARNAAARTAPDRGMRFQRITAALSAVEADAGMCLAGVALILERIERGAIELPYSSATGRWSAHAFTARYRADTLARPHIARFRAWLATESSVMRAKLSFFACGAPGEHPV